MLEDNAGDFWLTCGRGIFRIPRAQIAALVAGAAERVSAVGYGPETGASSATPVIGCYPSIVQSRDGRLWFSNQRGLGVLDPARKIAEGFAFPIRIEEVLVDGRITHHANGTVPTFGPGSGRVEIHYTGLQLYAPDRITFRYRLNGFDSDWIDADARRVAYYTNLPPGHYRFEVEATDFNGTPAPQPAVYTFSLSPHFYETRWFQALEVACMALLAIGVYRLRIAHHKRAERELQRRVDEAVAEVDVLDGLLPICAWCKKVREDTGYWSQVEAYVSARSRAKFTHGICPECAKEWSRGVPRGESTQTPGPT